MHILVWVLITIMMAMFALAMMAIDMTDEEFDKITRILIREVRLRWYFSKLIRGLKRA